LATHAIAAVLRLPAMSPALAGIGTQTSERLARRMALTKVEFEPGEVICVEGNVCTEAYVLRAGKVFTEYGEGRLEVMSEPRCVGMTELFARRAYQETVRAKGLVQAYKLTKGCAHPRMCARMCACLRACSSA
jgi:signal-transduction protein with cAMP-binding, CBS, and nucleotidyltransferase domain